MRFFVCGGGSGKDTLEAINKLDEVIEHSKPILYIPLAMNSEKYDSCYEWIIKELSTVNVPHIDMVRSIDELSNKEFNDYSCIFIGGGNTFKLLSELKKAKLLDRIVEYLDNDGILFGGSAGAIILGENINTANYMDKNEVGLEDTSALNLFDNMSIACHFTNEDEELYDKDIRHYTNISKTGRILALPEEITIYYDNGSYTVFGNGQYYVFEDNNVIVLGNSEKRRKEYLEIKDENDLMNFMNHYISYGWIDDKGQKHINNLKYFRETYRISGMEEVLNTGLGICSEQAIFIKMVLEKIGYETKLYVFRHYETEDNFDKEVKMHCFVLYRKGDKWYHFEHSNIPRRGIHEYNSVEEALKREIDNQDENDIRVLTEIPDIPEGLSFKEFNLYINQFGNNVD